MFELADREFKAIRNSTEEEIRKAEEYEGDEQESQEANQVDLIGPQKKRAYYNGNNLLNAFSFLKISAHFFSDHAFEAHKVDGFTEEIVAMSPSITRTQFNDYMKRTISKVKLYKTTFEKNNKSGETLNPYTTIRHCLYLADKEKFSGILTKISKDSFEQWLAKNSNGLSDRGRSTKVK